MINHTPFPTFFLKIFDNKFSDNKFFDTYFSIHICFTQPPRNRPQSKHRFLSPFPRNRSRYTDLLGTRANTLSLASSVFIASSLFPHHHRQSSKLARSSPSVDQPRLIRRVGWLHHISKDSGSRWSSRGAGTFLPIWSNGSVQMTPPHFQRLPV